MPNPNSIEEASGGIRAQEINHSRLRAFLLAILVTLPMPMVLAQETSHPQAAEIEGVVRDAAGKPVAGASVLLREEGRSSSAQTKTNDDGAFVFLSISAGMYAVKVEKSGFRDTTEDSIKLAPAEKKHCDVNLIPEEASASASSTADSSLNGIKLDDSPNFTVAGISDSAGSGGHGSETRMRTGDVLAQETVKLESGGPDNIPTAAGQLSRAREQVESKLANGKALSEKEEASLRHSLGDLDERLDDPLAAEREYERAAGLDPSEENYFAWGAELLLHRAGAPAIEVFGKGARRHPDSARMLAGLGAALYSGGSAEEAAQRLCEASDIEPASPAPYLFLGKIQEASPAPLPCAEQRLARFAHDQPANALANYYYALALWKRSRSAAEGSDSSDVLQHAQALLEKSCAIDPKLDVAYLQLGNLHFALGAFEEAVAAYKKAVATNPVGSEAHYRLGLAYKRLGENAKAQSEFDQYKQLDKTEAVTTERQRRELRQFLFVLKDQPVTGPSSEQLRPLPVVSK